MSGSVTKPAQAATRPAVAPSPRSTTRFDDKREVARQFEALFVAQMLKSARAAALADDPLAGNPTFRDLQDDRRAQALAAVAPLGVAKLLEGHQ